MLKAAFAGTERGIQDLKSLVLNKEFKKQLLALSIGLIIIRTIKNYQN